MTEEMKRDTPQAGQSPDQAPPVKEKRKKKGWVILLILLLLAALAAGGYFTWRQLNKKEVIEPNATIGIMPGKTDQEIIDELNRKVDERSIALTINPAPVAENGASDVNWMYENPQSNEKYTKLEVYRDDTGELIYETGMMVNGSYVEAAPLKVDLPAGTYACTAYVHGYRLSDQTYLGKVAAGLTLTIQN